DRRAAGLAAAQRLRRGDDPAARPTGQEAAHLERAARGLRLADTAEDVRPVALDRHAPALADAVLVDLELGLEPAVLRFDLEPRVARGRAVAALGDRAGDLAAAVVVARGIVTAAARSGCRGERDEHGGENCEYGERELLHLGLQGSRLTSRRLPGSRSGPQWDIGPRT